MYTFSNNTYTIQPKPDERDKIEVEIGDIKQPIFYPQIKAKRWDNEVNLSLRLVDAEMKPSYFADDNIFWETDDRRAVFYEKAKTNELSDGGHECEITLFKKPPTNRTTFTMQSKGLFFAYQGELTREQKENGAIRPDNVVGSYAVYYKDCPLNIEGGKIYRNGKSFHIYRPQAEDANGRKVWGVLSVDEYNGLVHVDLPVEFLDNATYPIRHVAGLTLGYTTAGGTSNAFANGNWKAGRVTTTMASLVSQISMYVLHYAAPSYKAMIVKDSDKSLITNGVGDAYDDSGAWGSKHWANLPYTTKPTLLNATNYYVGGISNGASNFYYDTGMGASYYVGYDDDNNYATPVSPVGGTYGSDTAVSSYITYTAAGWSHKLDGATPVLVMGKTPVLILGA